MKVNTRIATTSDLESLLDLEHACFTTDLINKRSFSRLLRSKSAAVLLIEKTDALIGLAIIFFRKNSKKARLYSFAIDDKYRNKGLAAILHAAIEDLVRQHKCELLTLEVDQKNSAAIAFYEKHGYQHFGVYPKYYENGADALRMKKLLSEN